jgi:hypothetical protein
MVLSMVCNGNGNGYWGLDFIGLRVNLSATPFDKWINTMKKIEKWMKLATSTLALVASALQVFKNWPQ